MVRRKERQEKLVGELEILIFSAAIDGQDCAKVGIGPIVPSSRRTL